MRVSGLEILGFGGTALLSLVVGACQPQTSAPKVSPTPELGRWTVIPAASQPFLPDTLDGRKMSPIFSAWRLDTKTGYLEFCTYYGGGDAVGKTVMPPTLDCAQHVDGPEEPKP